MSNTQTEGDAGLGDAQAPTEVSPRRRVITTALTPEVDATVHGTLTRQRATTLTTTRTIPRIVNTRTGHGLGRTQGHIPGQGRVPEDAEDTIHTIAIAAGVGLGHIQVGVGQGVGHTRGHTQGRVDHVLDRTVGHAVAQGLHLDHTTGHIQRTQGRQ